jgi:O-antigen/teichoic acid export membrane protein
MFVLADGLVLQGLVQFGTDRSRRPVVDATVAVLYGSVIAVLVGALLAASGPLGVLLGEERFGRVAALEVLFCAVTVPRTYCLRLLQRDIQTRQIFWIDLAWLGTMSIATVHGYTAGWLRSFESLAAIAIGGIATSSAVAVLLCRGMLRFERPQQAVARAVLGFGIGQMSASAIHTSVRQLDVVLAQSFFGTAMVGIYQAAKTIFRFFEMGIDAATSVVYPAVVRFYHTGDRETLHTIASKAMSLLLVVYVVACAAIWGGGSILGHVLGERYAAAVGQLHVLSLASLAMPLAVAGIVLVAAGYSAAHARISAVAALAALGCFIGSGMVAAPELFPLGVVAYYAVLGVGDWIAVVRRAIIGLRLGDLWRSLPDALAFVRTRRR